MDFDLLDLYGQASEWAGTKVDGAVSDLDARRHVMGDGTDAHKSHARNAAVLRRVGPG